MAQDRRARVAVAALFLTNGAIFANLLPRYPEIKADLHLSNAVYGAAIAAFSAGALVAGLASASTRTTTPRMPSQIRSLRCAPAARQIQGTLNGLGERCGNANLTSIIPTLLLEARVRRPLPDEESHRERLSTLTHASRLLDELPNRSPARQAPYVGESAFATKAGMTLPPS